MKKTFVTLGATILALTACGQTPKDSELKLSIAPTPALESSIVLKHDARLVDGNLDVIEIKRDAQGKYIVIHSITTAGFGAPVTTQVETLGEGLECSTVQYPGAGLLSIGCSRDDRPADGDLVEFKVKWIESGLQATLRTVTQGGLAGSEGSDETRVIASGLKIAN